MIDDETYPLLGDDEVEPAPLPRTEALAQLKDVAERQLALQHELEEAEAAVTRIKAKLADVAERELPDLMLDAGVPFFGLVGGGRVDVETSYHASVPVGAPEPQRQKAFAWLEKHGYGPIIKWDVTVQFGLNEAVLAKKFIAYVREKLTNQKISDRQQVNHQTLSKIVEERVIKTQEIPMDLLGVHVRRAAKITLPRSR